MFLNNLRNWLSSFSAGSPRPEISPDVESCEEDPAEFLFFDDPVWDETTYGIDRGI